MKTMSALGVYAASVVTALTAQNTLGVTAIHAVPAEFVREQIRAVVGDIRPQAVKIGMLNDAAVAGAVADELGACRTPVVLDPVMVSTSGHRLIEESAARVLAERLLPLCTVVTPNIPEAELLAGMRIRTNDDCLAAARAIRRLGAAAVLLKGGHREGREKCDFFLDSRAELHTFSTPTVETRNTHGTGCTLSSAIAAYLARGEQLADAVLKAKLYLQRALEAGSDAQIGEGHGPVNHFFRPEPLIIRRTAAPADVPTAADPC